MNNIEVFQDTQNRIQTDEKLKRYTEIAVNNTYVIDENFSSAKKPHRSDEKVYFQESLTLITAYRLADEGKKTAVLNFANSVNPGGGVEYGANAQEEYLCRASNLYNCLISDNAKPYYDYNSQLLKANSNNGMFLGSDKIVYSPGVTFFKEDIGYQPDTSYDSSQEFTAKWRNIDVITCAAPYFKSKRYALADDKLLSLMQKRIRNILEAAIDQDIQSLVLGAFGCGAFNNPPDVVAKAFQNVLLEERYLHSFSDVVFAIKRTGLFCENIEAFDTAFQHFPPAGGYTLSAESNKRRFFQ